MGKSDGGLRNLFKKKIPGHWQHVESPLTGGGIPDTNFCISGVEGWIECKKTESLSLKIRPEQVAWIDRRCRKGGRVYVAVRRTHSGGPRKGDPVDELWIYPGRRIGHLNRYGMTGDAPLGLYEGGPKNWNWVAITKVIRGDLHA